MTVIPPNFQEEKTFKKTNKQTNKKSVQKKYNDCPQGQTLDTPE